MLNIFLQNKMNKQGVLNVVHLRPTFILSFVMLKNMLILLVKAYFCLIFFFQKLQQNLLKPAGLSSDNSCHELHQSRFHCCPFLAASKNTSTTITDQ